MNIYYHVMKYFLFSIMILVGSITSPVLMASPTDDTSLSGDRSVCLTPRHSKDRKRTPSRLFIICNYHLQNDNSYRIHFQLPPDIAYLEIQLVNEDGDYYPGVVLQDSPSIDIYNLQGEFTMNCTTDQNQIYTGTLYF